MSTAAAHGYLVGTRVRYPSSFSADSDDDHAVFGTNFTLPVPLQFDTDYWVIASGFTTTDYKLSATRGGSEIDITVANTGGIGYGYHWTADLTTGKVTLDSAPEGVLTMDVLAGSTDAATIVISALGATNIDAGSKARFQGICSQVMGIYISDRRNRIDVADDIVKGIGAWYGYSREGMLRFGRVEANPANYDYRLIEDDLITVNSLQIEKLIPPEKKHRLSYKKNWTNQSGALFGSMEIGPYTDVSYSTDYSITTPVGSADVGVNGSYHALAIIPDVQETLIAMLYADLTPSGEADTEAARLDAMYYGWGAIFSGEFSRIGTQIDIGTVVNLTHSRFGLAGGVNMTCPYVEDRPSEDKVILKFFAALASYTPGQL